jgi:NADH:ubiquinone oxidoreductase subunit H
LARPFFRYKRSGLFVWVDFFFFFLFILLSVAFFTLFERKVMGYSHFRFGPLKVGFLGVFQPFSDALKLFSKEFGKGGFFLFYYYLMGPFLGFVFMGVL